MLCRVAAVKSLLVHHPSAGYIFISFGNIEPILVILKIEYPFKPALEGVSSLANYSVAYEETQSNGVSDFRDFVCSLFPKAIFLEFYFTT